MIYWQELKFRIKYFGKSKNVPKSPIELRNTKMVFKYGINNLETKHGLLQKKVA